MPLARYVASEFARLLPSLLPPMAAGTRRASALAGAVVAGVSEAGCTLSYAESPLT